MNIKVRYFSASQSTYEGDIEVTDTCVIIRYVDSTIDKHMKIDKPVEVIIPLSAIWQVVIT